MTRPSLALALLAPADAARAGGAGKPVMEFASFRLIEGAGTPDFLAAAQDTEAALRERGALIRRSLTVDETGLWTDVIEWHSMEDAQDAAGEVMADPAFQPFLSLIDGSTVTMRHAGILWQME